MKKLFRIMMLVGIVFFIGACGNGAKEEKTVYENTEQPGIVSTLTYFHKGDKVTKQTTRTVMNYKEIGIKDKEMAEDILNAAGAELYKDVKGIKHSITYSDTEAVEELTVNYPELDASEAAGIPGITVTGDTKNGVSLKASEELLKKGKYIKK